MTSYEIDVDPQRVDINALWRFLSSEAHWGTWRTRTQVEQQVEAAWRVAGAYAFDGAMIGFARALSDGVSIAYLADVYVITEARGQGVGTALVRAIVEDGPGAHLRWMLHTFDAHDLYRPFGFTEPDHRYLERPGSFDRGQRLP